MQVTAATDKDLPHLAELYQQLISNEFSISKIVHRANANAISMNAPKSNWGHWVTDFIEPVKSKSP